MANPLETEKTFSLQSQLPPLPLPSLDDTCEKYLTSVQPFVDAQTYAETEVQVNSFRDGIGKELNKHLIQLSQVSRNWLANMWYETYFDYRGPLPMINNLAGGQVMTPDFFQPELGTQVERAAYWVYASALMFGEILRQELPVQKLKRTHPMDMIQYLNFFCAGRIPGKDRDLLSHHITYSPKRDGTMEVSCYVKHAIAFVKGRIFKVNVFDKKGELLLPCYIQKQLQHMVSICDEEGEAVQGIGALTAADRDTYFKAYQHLCRLDKQNKVNLDIINQAIIGMALDDVEAYNLQDSVEQAAKGPCTNRWFDKPLFGVISTTGLVGSNHDHVHCDGNAGTEVMKNIKDKIRDNHKAWKNEFRPQEYDDPVEIKFTVDPYILELIEETKEKYNALMSQVVIVDRVIQGFGKDFSKKNKLNPDTLVQLAVQLAYYTQHRKIVPTYESGTTRMFYHGRTETVRSCTCESKSWLQSMLDDSCSVSEKRRLFREAAETHINLMMEACQGQGIDRHLFALKKIAEQEGVVPLPSIFTDESWKLSGGDGNFVLSTSLSGFHEVHGTIAPMMFDGYGIFYTIDNDAVYMSVSTWAGSTETDAPTMYSSVENAFSTIQNLLHQQSKL